MKLRDRIRAWRLYYRSRPLFREMLEKPRLAYLLPWLPRQRDVSVRFRNGRVFRMPAARWPLLPTACRLERIEADFEFFEEAKRVRIDGLTLYSPAWARDEAANYGEVLLGDVYDIHQRDLRGCVVIDVGSYVGDSTMAYARRGARVHAFEPSRTFCTFLRRNLAENGLAHCVLLHEVGLAESDCVTDSRHDVLRFVEGVSYALAKLPSGVDILKLDCEGAEYHLLADPRFLAHLAPREIRMEYHRGLAGVLAPLRQAGYDVVVHSRTKHLGMLSARRQAARPAVHLKRVA
jgi:FkbM family methyltransferase